MKKIIISFTAFIFLSQFSLPVFASDPCETVLCMFGKAMGSGGGAECTQAERDFFNIKKTSKGSFLPNHTSDARKNFIMQCKSADPSAITKIISSFGRIRG